MVSGRRRGQHTENPFESATLNLRRLDEYRLPSAAELAAAVARRAAESAAYPELKNEMDRVLAEAKEHTSADIKRVTGVLLQHGLL